MIALDHLVGQQVTGMDEDKQTITFEDGTIIYMATDLHNDVTGLTLVKVTGADDPDKKTHMVFGIVTLDDEGSPTTASETEVNLDPAEYGIAAPEADEIVYPEQQQDPEVALPADPSSERVVDQPLGASESASEGMNGSGES